MMEFNTPPAVTQQHFSQAAKRGLVFDTLLPLFVFPAEVNFGSISNHMPKGSHALGNHPLSSSELHITKLNPSPASNRWALNLEMCHLSWYSLRSWGTGVNW